MLSIIISLISGLVLGLAFPRLNAWWAAWFALAPLMRYVYSQRWSRAAACGFAFGVGFFGVLLYWISVFGRLPCVVLVIYQSLFVVGFVVIAKLVGQRMGPWGRLFLLPAAWVVWEWIRSLGAVGFTWGDLGYSQYKALPVIQMSAYTGVWGVSFLLVFFNALLANVYEASRRPRGLRALRFQIMLVLVVLVAVVMYGLICLVPYMDSKLFQVVVVQGNVDQGTEIDAGFVDKSWRTYTDLTSKAADQGAYIIVWPETVVPGLTREWYNAARLKSLADATGSNLLVGGWDKDSAEKIYNAAFIVSPHQGLVSQYAKVHLVPFGEYVPFRKQLPFLNAYHVTAYDTSSGSGFNPLEVNGMKIGTAICFESIFQDILRRMTLEGANVLCVITNDCWYDETAAAEQHMAMSVLRAVENHRWLIRGASTGISCVIDPNGRIVSSLGVKKAGIVRALVVPLEGRTLFTRRGELVLWVSLLVVFASGCLALRNRKNEGK